MIRPRAKWIIAALSAIVVGKIVIAAYAQTPAISNPSSDGPAPEAPSTEPRAPGSPVKARVIPANTKEEIDAWRKQYAYRSLADRLEYEKPFRGQEPLVLPEPAKQLLKEIEEPKDGSRSYRRAFGRSRVLTLQSLHSEKLEAFAERQDFGVRRLPLPGPAYLEMIPERDPIPFEKAPPLSAEFDGEKSLALPPTEQAAEASNPVRLPSREQIIDFHLDSQDQFVSLFTLGDVKSLDRVAGFEPHGFLYLPVAPRNAAQPLKDPSTRQSDYDWNYWRIIRLDLVSLLKHTPAAVYVSEHLPRMDELAAAKTRPLTQFEQGSLEKLRGGEDLLTHVGTNRISMLGAVRASKECLACHQVPRGTLLGAFSYDLQRDPPIPVGKTFSGGSRSASMP